MSDTHSDVNRRFAHNLFSGTDDDDDQARDHKRHRRDSDDDDQARDHKRHRRDSDDDGRADQRRFAAELFAPDDPDAGILAGLPEGRTVGRTTPPRADPVPTTLDRYAADAAPARPTIWI
ncbi:Uncharacterised protein [Mycobacteroides abscessus subsp. massiliense]|uniref:hypothetical protein n=1 Tax=Mycobacteroides abscessus TaxID=36809 RepID=UPI0009A904B0|nr:hypothetical protein [Mycobacteroides abscessus]SLE60950.1 Uncharacterised protein [Mycobacteroides abscessus subsp. massiliense]